jgi:hypothetical protein
VRFQGRGGGRVPDLAHRRNRPTDPSLNRRRTPPPQEADSAKRLKELVESEKKGAGRPAKESQDELMECEAVFGNF